MFKTCNTDAPALRTLSTAEVDAVAGGRIVIAGCTDPIQWRHPADVIIFNPWITPGTPERMGTGRTAPF